jgi:hypothetical protein
MNTNAITNKFYDVETIPERAEQEQLNKLRTVRDTKKASFERARETERLTKEIKEYTPPSKAQKVAQAVGSGLKQIGATISKYKVSRRGIKAGTLQANQNKAQNNVNTFYSRFGQQKSAQERSKDFFNRFS